MKPWDNIILSDVEKEEAHEEWRKRKYFHEKHKEHWAKLESPEGKTKVTELKKEKGI